MALPETVEQVQAILRVCWELGAPVVARGAGTDCRAAPALSRLRAAQPGQVQRDPGDRRPGADRARPARRA
uniref:FAD-binding protein n=1 Tax=Phenylobacterium glaciei TaxID=2803784 RepID=A0A974S960_9CAUL|nr:FAD-binding protein [Phenylobacterium glaciei]